MKKLASVLSLAILAVLASGCYHATVETGLTPSPQVVRKPWASSWIGGLVPPSTVSVKEQCGAAGVAKVETQLSFLNMVASAVTFGIFTPMQIDVTCATGAGTK